MRFDSYEWVLKLILVVTTVLSLFYVLGTLFEVATGNIPPPHNLIELSVMLEFGYPAVFSIILFRRISKSTARARLTLKRVGPLAVKSVLYLIFCSLAAQFIVFELLYGSVYLFDIGNVRSDDPYSIERLPVIDFFLGLGAAIIGRRLYVSVVEGLESGGESIKNITDSEETEML